MKSCTLTLSGGEKESSILSTLKATKLTKLAAKKKYSLKAGGMAVDSKKVAKLYLQGKLTCNADISYTRPATLSFKSTKGLTMVAKVISKIKRSLR